MHCLLALCKNTVSNFTYVKNLINYQSVDYLVIIIVKIIYDFSIIRTACSGSLRIVKHFHYPVMDFIYIAVSFLIESLCRIMDVLLALITSNSFKALTLVLDVFAALFMKT